VLFYLSKILTGLKNKLDHKDLKQRAENQYWCHYTTGENEAKTN
jgi:hypothetical protein